MYGFLVPPERLEQYRQDASISMAREEARAEAWEQFLDEQIAKQEAEEEEKKREKAIKDIDNKTDEATLSSSSLSSTNSASSSSSSLSSAADADARTHATTSQGDQTAGSRSSSSSSSLSSSSSAADTSTTAPSGRSAGGGSPRGGSDEIMAKRAAALSRVFAESCSSENRRTLSELVEGGVPMAMRTFVWPLFLELHEERYDEMVGKWNWLGGSTSSTSSESARAKYVNSILPRHRQRRAKLPDYQYQLKNISLKLNAGWIAQIKKDLPRTFPDHPALDSRGRSALGRVLAAYVAYNNEDGYCQGMNFIAGLLILFMSEEPAFRALSQLLKCILQGYHAQDLKTLLVDQYVFDSLLQEKFPEVAEHLSHLGVTSSAVTAHWFLTAFVNTLQMEALLRVWDVLLFEGSVSVLMRMALALVKSRQESVLAMEDSADVLATLQRMPANTCTSEMDALLTDVCCNYADVNDEKINELRNAKLRYVEEEARSLANRGKASGDGSSDIGKFISRIGRSFTSLTTATSAPASSRPLAREQEGEESTSSSSLGDGDNGDKLSNRTEEKRDDGDRRSITATDVQHRSMSACDASDIRHAEVAAAGAALTDAMDKLADIERELQSERRAKEAAFEKLRSNENLILELQDRIVDLEKALHAAQVGLDAEKITPFSDPEATRSAWRSPLAETVEIHDDNVDDDS